MIKIAICDDNLDMINDIKKLIELTADCEFEVNSFISGKDLLNTDVKEYDIIFLDIEIGDMIGTDIALELRAGKVKALIFFVTNYSAYISEAFKSIPFQYILKPIDEKLFTSEFNRAIKKLKDNKSIFQIKTNNGEQSIKIKDILYIEYASRRIEYHLKSGVVQSYGTMNELEKAFANYYIVRAHSGFLVNLKRIKSIKGFDVILDNEEKIQVSRKYLEELRSKYARCIVEVSL